jgi:hypothetical protein
MRPSLFRETMPMPSFQFAPSPRKRVTGRFITRVRRELQKAFLEEKEARGITQAKLARILGVNRAVVCRQLAGTANLTLRTLGDYAWALERDLNFSMPKLASAVDANHSAVPLDTSALPTTPHLVDQSPAQTVSSQPNVLPTMAAAG